MPPGTRVGEVAPSPARVLPAALSPGVLLVRHSGRQKSERQILEGSPCLSRGHHLTTLFPSRRPYRQCERADKIWERVIPPRVQSRSRCSWSTVSCGVGNHAPHSAPRVDDPEQHQLFSDVFHVREVRLVDRSPLLFNLLNRLPDFLIGDHDASRLGFLELQTCLESSEVSALYSAVLRRPL